MKYQWIMFDADDTLFHFDIFAGLTRLFTHYGVAFSRTDFEQFQAVNKPLWVDYQNGIITAVELQVKRFSEWAIKLDVDPLMLNQQFIEAMAEICQCLPGARELLEQLFGKARLAIITNGFTALQKARLARTGLTHLFEHVIISDQVGVAKPHPAIFEHALTQMGGPEKSQVLMVGDTLQSDILGGKRFGVDTCWLNHQGDKVVDDVGATYQVASLTELSHLITRLSAES